VDVAQPSAARAPLGRRLFVQLGLSLLAVASAGCVTTTGATSQPVTSRTVSISTASGTASALLYHPEGEGRWPAILVWTDASGLRPAYDAIGRKIAADGYVVLVPNAYYRSIDLDGRSDPPAASPEQTRERSTQWRAATTEEAVMADARAFVAFLDAQPQVDTGRKVGTVGFDYGSANAFHAARALPDRIGAVAALYPSGTATPRPNSPHLFVGQSRAAYYVALARNDNEREPGDKEDYRKAFTDAGLTGMVEVLPADHGFAITGERAFDSAAADAALARVLETFRRHLD